MDRDDDTPFYWPSLASLMTQWIPKDVFESLKSYFGTCPSIPGKIKSSALKDGKNVFVGATVTQSVPCKTHQELSDDETGWWKFQTSTIGIPNLTKIEQLFLNTTLENNYKKIKRQVIPLGTWKWLSVRLTRFAKVRWTEGDSLGFDMLSPQLSMASRTAVPLPISVKTVFDPWETSA